MWNLTDFCFLLSLFWNLWFLLILSILVKCSCCFCSQWGRCLLQTQNARIQVICQNMVIVLSAEPRSLWFPQGYFCLQFGCRFSPKSRFLRVLLGFFNLAMHLITALSVAARQWEADGRLLWMLTCSRRSGLREPSRSEEAAEAEHEVGLVQEKTGIKD